MLVLNASYEPINVCTVRRAAVLVLKQRAEVLEQSGKYLEMGITEQVVYMRGDNPDRSAARLAEMLPELRRLQPVAS